MKKNNYQTLNTYGNSVAKLATIPYTPNHYKLHLNYHGPSRIYWVAQTKSPIPIIDAREINK